MSSTQPPLGVVLLVGGCGFLGTHLAQAILAEPTTSKLYVLDRSPPRIPTPGVTYIQGSIISASTITSAFQTVQPNVVFHAASPNMSFPTHSLTNDFYDTNVTGTELLLKTARESGVRAFVYTSSSDVYAHPPHNNIDENYPTWDAVPEKTQIYSFSKAVGDARVRSASTPNFRTTSLRLVHLYGDGDSQGVPAALDACAGSQPLFKMGDGSNHMELLSTYNASTAHVLAAKALLDKREGVNGEAFNIADGGEKVGFWEFFVRIWSTARGRDVEAELWTIPASVVWFLVAVMEWIFWVGTLGMVRPKGVAFLERVVIEFCLMEHTYDGTKARERLGFKPKLDREKVLEKSVKWEMKRREELAQMGKKKA